MLSPASDVSLHRLAHLATNASRMSWYASRPFAACVESGQRVAARGAELRTPKTSVLPPHKPLVTAANELLARDDKIPQHQTHFIGPTSALITTLCPFRAGKLAFPFCHFFSIYIVFSCCSFLFHVFFTYFYVFSFSDVFLFCFVLFFSFCSFFPFEMYLKKVLESCLPFDF